MIDRCHENVIEWINGDEEVFCTFSQKKYINRIKKMAQNHPSCVEILAENKDGSLCCKIPLRAVHLTIYDSKRPSFAKVEEDDE